MKKRAASLALVLSMILSFTCQAGAVDANSGDDGQQVSTYAALEASRGDGTYPVREEMLTIAKLVATNANNVAPWLRTQEGWNSTPARAAGADAFDFNLYPTGWRLNKNGYGQYGDTAHSWVPLIGSSAKKTWRLNNVKATSNYWFNDNLDAGNPAVGIRCVKNYKVKK